MGTSKRLVLASIVSLMMVLALGVGLLPSYTESSVGAAGGARADAPSIFTQYFGVKAVDTIVATSTLDDLTIKTPVDNATDPALLVPLGSMATNPEAMAQVTYVLEEEKVPMVGEDPQTLTGFDLTPDSTIWDGDPAQTAGPVADPFSATIDVANFFYSASAGSVAKSLIIYALANTTAGASNAQIVYEERSSNTADFADAPRVNLVQVANDIDDDDNGLPDLPFTDVPEGNIWVAEDSVATSDGAVRRTALLANLDQNLTAKQAGTVVVQPRADITVSVPDLDALVLAGLVGANEQALVLVSVADSLAAAIDEYSGDDSAAARAAWSDAVLDRAPGSTELSPSVFVTILATTDSGANYTEITDFGDTGLTAAVVFTDLSLGDAAFAQLYSYPLMTTDNVAKQAGAILITNEVGVGEDDDLQAWNHVANSISNDTGLAATTTLLGNFGVFDSLAITSAEPDAIPASTSVTSADVKIIGVIPTDIALSVAEANATYTITATVSGATLTAEFRDGGSGSAITALGEEGVSNSAFVTLSGDFANATGDITITITDIASGNSASGTPISIEPVRSIATQVQVGAAGSPADSSDITLDPAKTQAFDGLADGEYLDGDTVTATYTGTGTVTAWLVNGVEQAAASSVVFSVNGDTTVIAVIDEAANVYSITVQRLAEGSSTPEAGFVSLTPTSSPGEAAGDFLEGTSVNATYTGDGTFLRWEISAGTISTTGAFIVSADATVTAVYQVTTPDIFTISTAIRDLDSGAVTNDTGITLNPASSTGLAAGQYYSGAMVDADYAGPDNFVRFEITNGLTIDAVSGAFTVTGDATVTGVYQEPTPCRTIEVSLSNTSGGTVSLSPEQQCYDEGSQVTLTATTAPGYDFEGWEFTPASIGTGLDLTSNPITITVPALASKADIMVLAKFMLGTGVPVIDGQNPLGDPMGDIIDEAWLFGGIVSQVNATNMNAGDTVTFSLDGSAETATATVFQRTPVSDPEIIIPVAPASWFTSATASVLANVTVTNEMGSDTASNVFTYKQFAVAQDGVNTTAFVIDPGVTNSVDVWDGTTLGNIVLDLPTLDTNLTQVFGIARNVQIDFAKNNTASLGTVGFDSALSADEGGDFINNAFDFTFHLYGPLAAKQTTPSAGNAAFSQQSDLSEFERTVDVNGNPVQDSAALLTFPATATGLTAADVREGLLVWGIELEYDYAAEETVPVAPQDTAYQSELLVNEVNPALNNSTPSTTAIDMVNQARLFTLNGFTLRQNAIFDEEVANGIRLNTDTGTFVANSTSGGDALTIVSALGGLGWVDRVEFVSTGTNNVLGTASTFPTGSADGTTEYELDLTSPASDTAGVADLVIYLKSNTTTEAARLDRAFEYKATGGTDFGLLFLLLGLIVAIIGLASGGDSGGGGGGPCFIATAAYGTPLASDIDSLRVFRDEYLLSNAVGSAFVDAYYTVSPSIADVVAQNPVLAALVRIALVPVVAISRMALTMPLMTAALAFILATALVMRRRARKVAK